MRVEWMPEALDDLDRAVDYISRDKSRAAQEMAQRIWDATRSLADHPGLGRPGRVFGTRELVISDSPYIAPYAVLGERVVILRLLHGAMRWPRLSSETQPV